MEIIMKAICDFDCDNCVNAQWVRQYLWDKNYLSCKNEDRVVIESIVADERHYQCRNYKHKKGDN